MSISWYVSYSGTDNSFNNLSDNIIDGIINEHIYEEVVSAIDEDVNLLDAADSEDAIIIVDDLEDTIVVDEETEEELLQLADDITETETQDTASELIEDEAVAAIDVDAIVATTVEEIVNEIAQQDQGSSIFSNNTSNTIDLETIAETVTDEVVTGADLANNANSVQSTENIDETAEIAIVDTDNQEQIATYTKEELKELVQSIAMSILNGNPSEQQDYQSMNVDQRRIIQITSDDSSTLIFFDMSSMINEMEQVKLLDTQINSGSFRISKQIFSDQRHGGLHLAQLLAETTEKREEEKKERREQKIRIRQNEINAERLRLSYTS